MGFLAGAGPVTGEPPYAELEVERIASALASGGAWGTWLSTNEAVKHAFAIPWVGRLEPGERLRLVERGALYVLEFAPAGKKILPADLPRFSTMRWLDLWYARKVLLRVRELEFAAGKRDVPSGYEIEESLSLYERARVESLPKLRRLVAAVAGPAGDIKTGGAS